MTDKAAMTMRQIREGLGHTVPPADIPEPIVQPTAYSVNCLTEDGINSHNFAIAVEYRGHDLWAVVRHRQCLGVDGEWSWESIPSEREDEWLAAHRFDEQTALRLAKEHAPKVTVNGFTVADALRMRATREETQR